MAETTYPEIYMCYHKDAGTFEFKLDEKADPVTFPEAAVGDMAATMAATKGGADMKDLFLFLVEQARKDPEGKWVSASAKPKTPGQATVGNS